MMRAAVRQVCVVGNLPAAMASHYDVDVPLILRPRLGSLLEEFECFLAGHGRVTRRKAKSAGGHITAWWLIWSESTKCSAQSRILCGETVCRDVNPVPHLWVQGSPRLPYLSTALDLLRQWMAQAAAAAAPPPPPPPLPALPVSGDGEWVHYNGRLVYVESF